MYTFLGMSGISGRTTAGGVLGQVAGLPGASCATCPPRYPSRGVCSTVGTQPTLATSSCLALRSSSQLVRISKQSSEPEPGLQEGPYVTRRRLEHGLMDTTDSLLSPAAGTGVCWDDPAEPHRLISCHTLKFLDFGM